MIQRDDYIFCLKTIEKYAATFTVLSFSLIKAALWNNSIWYSDSGYDLFLAYIDIFITFSLSPIYITFISVLYLGRTVISDRWVVFIAPISMLYIFVATSYASYTLGLYTILISLWLGKYRLEFKLTHLTN